MAFIKLNGAKKAAQEYRSIFLRGQRLAPVKQKIAETLYQNTMEAFRNESSPQGVPWPKSNRARRDGGKTLQDTKRLIRNVRAQAQPNPRVFVDPSIKYAELHQFGGVNNRGYTIPARPFIGLKRGQSLIFLGWVTRFLITGKL